MEVLHMMCAITCQRSLLDKNVITNQTHLFIGGICFHLTETTKVVQPEEEPPTKEPTGQNTDSSSQSQPKDETASTGTSAKATILLHVQIGTQLSYNFSLYK